MKQRLKYISLLLRLTAIDCNGPGENLVLQIIFDMLLAKKNEAVVAKKGIT
jgi:hypothetical protein